MRRTAVCALGYLILAACITGTSENGAPSPRPPDEDPLSSVTFAPERMMGAESARFAVRADLDSPRDPYLTISGEGVVDISERRSSLRVDIAGLSRAAPPRARMIIRNFDIFIRSADLAPRLGTRRWVKVHQSEVSGLDVELDALGQVAHYDPSAALHFLGGAEEVEDLGSEEIGGVPTTHYRAAVNLHHGENPPPRRLKPSVTSSIFHVWRWTRRDETITVDVWLDEDGLVRRQTMNLDYNAGSEAGMSVDITTDLFDFGTDVVIDIPDSKESVQWFRVDPRTT